MRLIANISILILLITSASMAQIRVTGSFVQDSIVIGDVAQFTLSIETSAGDEILAVPRVFLDSVYSALQTFRANPNDTTSQPQPIRADYELTDLGAWSHQDDDEIFSGTELGWNESKVGSTKLLENTFSLRLWDPGQTVVLLPPVVYRTADGQQQQHYERGQVPIYVIAPPGLENIHQDSLETAPIKPILTEPLTLADFLLPLAIILGIAVVIGLYFLYKKYIADRVKQQETIVEPEIIIPAHERALSSLSELRDRQLWQKGQVKEYQSELTRIIRAYLEDRYDIPALENTTQEIVQSLTSGQLMTDGIDSLKRILQVADLVKFAKASPEESIHDAFMDEAVQLVQSTKEIEATEDE